MPKLALRFDEHTVYKEKSKVIAKKLEEEQEKEPHITNSRPFHLYKLK